MSLKVAFLLSGRGSTYDAVASRIVSGEIDAQVVRVIASKASAGGVEIAEGYGHPVTVVNVKDPAHHDQISRQLIDDGAELVILAGYMHLWNIAPELMDKTLNIHPSLIPAFCGKGMYGHHVHEAVIARGAKVSGCTIHLVDGEYDHGRILEQRVVEVKSEDTPESLQEKVQKLEKELLIHVVKAWKDYR